LLALVESLAGQPLIADGSVVSSNGARSSELKV
jgi:hypothetical protein